jgi:hypothetical protein
MTASISSRLSLAVISGLVCLGLNAGIAQAREVFPGELQTAAGLQCAPSCIACHTTNPGQAGTAKKRFGIKMAAAIATGVGPAWEKLVMAAEGGDAESQELVTAIRAGIDADTGANLCGVQYGCGARIAKDEPRDDWSGLLFVAGAMGLGAILRRAKRR